MRDMNKQKEAIRNKKRKKVELLKLALNLIIERKENKGEPDFGYANILKTWEEVSKEDGNGIKTPGTLASISGSEEYKSIIQTAQYEYNRNKGADVTYDWDAGNHLTEHELRMRIDILLRDNAELTQRLVWCEKSRERFNIEYEEEKNSKSVVKNNAVAPNFQYIAKMLAEAWLDSKLGELRGNEGQGTRHLFLDADRVKHQKLLNQEQLRALGLL